MTKKRAKLSEQVRQAVQDCGMTRYRICKIIGLDQSNMSRFMRGIGGLQQDSLDALAELLNLELKQAGKPGKGKVKHGKRIA